MKKLSAFFLVLVTMPAFAQIHVGVNGGASLPNERFRIPKPYQNHGFFMDNRFGYYVGASVEKPWQHVSGYANLGLTWYRTYLGIGPWLNPAGQYSYPTYLQFDRHIGSHVDLGIRKTVYRRNRIFLDLGCGIGALFNHTDHDLTYPQTREGYVLVEQVLRYDTEFTYHNPHSLYVSAHSRFRWASRQGRHWWLKVHYNQGINKSTTGTVAYSDVDFSGNETYRFSFPVSLLRSFFSFTLGYQLYTFQAK